LTTQAVSCRKALAPLARAADPHPLDVPTWLTHRLAFLRTFGTVASVRVSAARVREESGLAGALVWRLVTRASEVGAESAPGSARDSIGSSEAGADPVAPPAAVESTWNSERSNSGAMGRSRALAKPG
jgi:hypothetical protein